VVAPDGLPPRSSSLGLNLRLNVTTSFILALADKGWRRALNDDPHLRNGLNVHDGRITYRAGPRPKGREFLFC